MIREYINSAIGVLFLFGMLWATLNLHAINTPDGFGFMIDGVGGYFWQYGE